MAETNDFPVSSPMAVQRQQAMLPTLLSAVRQRRQRRRAARAAAVLCTVALVAVLAQPWWRSAQRADDRPIEVAGSWSTIVDDPTVLARCEVRPVVRTEWFVDDASLHDLLAGADRDAGLVRAGGRVRVSAAAIDRWGSEMQ